MNEEQRNKALELWRGWAGEAEKGKVILVTDGLKRHIAKIGSQHVSEPPKDRYFVEINFSSLEPEYIARIEDGIRRGDQTLITAVLEGVVRDQYFVS